MKIRVSNVSSGLLALPSPLSVTLGAGKSAVLSISDPEWKAVASSPQIARLVSARMLSLAPVQEAKPVEAPKPPEPVAAPEPVVEPAPVVEQPAEPTPEPVVEPVVEEPAAPAVEAEPAPAAEEPAPEPVVEKKKKKKS